MHQKDNYPLSKMVLNFRAVICKWKQVKKIKADSSTFSGKKSDAVLRGLSEIKPCYEERKVCVAKDLW